VLPRRLPTRVLAVAVAFCAVVTLAGCFPPSAADLAAVKQAVVDLSPPPGWTEVESIDVACHPGHPGCEDDSAHRAFHSLGTVEQACAAVTSWVLSSTTVFSEPIAVVGPETATPNAADCVSEIATAGEYVINTGAADLSLPSSSRWAMRLRPDSLGGWRLSVVLGSPPRDPWSSSED
jgi:hypothetical protein